jgi:hypothetical protein
LRDWLKRFRDDRPDRQRPPAVSDLREPGNPTPGKTKGEWLDRFRDDETDPNWLARFRDDEPERNSKPRSEPAPKGEPRSARRALIAGPSRHIRLFEWLMYISLVVEVATTASDFEKLAELAGGWYVVVLADLFTLAFFGVFIFVAVYLRQRWALYVIAAFYAFRLVRYIPSFAYIALPLVQFLSAVQFILQGLALFYAFSGDAPAHFAKNKR